MSRRRDLVLASASSARAAMLANAGVSFVCEPSTVDESPIKTQMRLNGSTSGQTALALAEAKAMDVARRRRGGIVIGADQILECNNDWFDKPNNQEQATETLQKLRDRSHILVSAVVVARDEACPWRFVDTARLTMRPFSDVFLRRYIDQAGDEILASVGAYRIEGMGIQLFSRLEGDCFTILGMPLLPLLDFLRQNGFLET